MTKPGVACAIGVMARAPSAPGKTRLAPHLSDARLRTLRTALLADTLDVVSRVSSVDRFIFFTPDEAEPEIAGLADASFTRLRQRGTDLGQRMRSAFDELLEVRGYESAMLIGSDVPLLTADHFAAARQSLLTDRDVALGPADDGGYYLIGMRTPNASLFDGVPWGTATVLFDTRRAAERLGLVTHLMPPAYDIDTIDDLRRLERDLAIATAGVAPHASDWFARR